MQFFIIGKLQYIKVIKSYIGFLAAYLVLSLFLVFGWYYHHGVPAGFIRMKARATENSTMAKEGPPTALITKYRQTMAKEGPPKALITKYKLTKGKEQQTKVHHNISKHLEDHGTLCEKDGMKYNKSQKNQFRDKSNLTKPLCPCLPENPAIEDRKPDLTILDWDIMEKKWTQVKEGGRWNPSNCTPRSSVAILVPYRQRDEHLHIFINYMHAFLQRQLLEYGIYIIEQAGSALFNRAKLLNVGFKEAMSDHDWGCVALHDVDSLPMNDRNLYHCPHKPRHLSVAMEKFHFRSPSTEFFGGVTLLKSEHYKLVNGMSNIYWGWGAEDDDLYYRVRGQGLTPILRSSMKIGKYRSIKKYHKSAPQSKVRLGLLRAWKGRWRKDGLVDLQYTVLKKQRRLLFSYFLVDIGKMA